MGVDVVDDGGAVGLNERSGGGNGDAFFDGAWLEADIGANGLVEQQTHFFDVNRAEAAGFHAHFIDGGGKVGQDVFARGPGSGFDDGGGADVRRANLCTGDKSAGRIGDGSDQDTGGALRHGRKAERKGN